MSYISNESEFWLFMHDNGPNAEKSKSNYISWLKFISVNGYGSINESITKSSVENIYQKLINTIEHRAVYKTDKDILNIRSALNKYLKFTTTRKRELGLHNDLVEILRNEPSTSQKLEIEVRIGQGVYRKNLIKLWGMCSVTKYSRTDFLIASHIKPWRFSTSIERVDPYNGLLLTPNIDTLFDTGYISFSNVGGIVFSSLLDNTDKAKMGVVGNMMLHKVYDKNIPYLAYHRECILLK